MKIDVYYQVSYVNTTQVMSTRDEAYDANDIMGSLHRVAVRTQTQCLEDLFTDALDVILDVKNVRYMGLNTHKNDGQTWLNLSYRSGARVVKYRFNSKRKYQIHKFKYPRAFDGLNTIAKLPLTVNAFTFRKSTDELTDKEADMYRERIREVLYSCNIISIDFKKSDHKLCETFDIYDAYIELESSVPDYSKFGLPIRDIVERTRNVGLRVIAC